MSLFSNEVKMLEVELPIVRYTIAIVIDVSFSSSICGIAALTLRCIDSSMYFYTLNMYINKT